MGNTWKRQINGICVEIKLYWRMENTWELFEVREQEDGLVMEAEKIKAWLKLNSIEGGAEYELSMKGERAAQIRLELEPEGESLGVKDFFHMIPSNIFGDNNLAMARTGEYPMLTLENPEDVFCSPFWEFRADRASQPVVMLCGERGILGLSVAPYTETGEEVVRNGIRVELPRKIAVSLGYSNDPVTYVNKREYWPPSRQMCSAGTVKGRIYAFPGQGRRMVHKIVEREYGYTREVPVFQRTPEEAAEALMEQFMKRNWSDKWRNYTNMECHLPQDGELRAWRQLAEIGWTGGGVLGYPFAVAQDVLHLPEDYFAGKLSPGQIVDEIVAGYHEESGFFNDVTRPDWNPAWPSSPVNGWWSGMGLARDCHCAYTNGSAVYYILKLLCYQRGQGREIKEKWLDGACKVLDTVMYLQREDGCYGYTYRYDRKEVLDWDGFAGCWFASAMPYAFRLTENSRYLESAQLALEYYSSFVENLSCYGTPMDTWKSVDEEGNLAFIRAARQMHELTGDPKYLEYLEAGAGYQYLWQYGFKARPQYRPLCESDWNSCGASVTSVSNPHTHPMGTLIIDDLEYLAEQTGSVYHAHRAEDAFAWLMNTLELYPEVSGYGEYGVMTERYCPSDGLVIETYADGSPSSMWFTYNGWAAANALEAILERLRKHKEQGGAGRNV